MHPFISNQKATASKCPCWAEQYGNLNCMRCEMARKWPAVGRKPQNPRLGHRAGEMNKLEAKYADFLETRKQAGEIISWRFEEIKFRLADKTWLLPDFQIMLSDGSIEYHETKGFMQEDANVKLKAVADKYREYRWILVRWDSKKKEWLFEEK